MLRATFLICIAVCYQATVAPSTAVPVTDAEGHNIAETPKILLSLGPEDTEEAELEDGSLEITESPPEDEADDEDLDFMNRGVRAKNFLRFGRSASARRASSSSSKEGKTIRLSRGEPDDNFIRLGRSANFVRLGRGDSDAPSPPATRSAGSNFIRLGRGKDNNFIRLGRGKDNNFIRLGRGKDNNFIRLGRGKDNNFIRLGRGKDSNFIRLGRGKDSNFIRLGRDQETSEDDSSDVTQTSSGTPRMSRGGPDSNFIRLGRGGLTGNNFVRLGRRDNFLRFGRGSADSTFIRLGKAENFLRLGRSGLGSDPARYGSGKKSDPLYFGRGKLADRNFIRLGRSDPLLSAAGEHSLDADAWKPTTRAGGVDNKFMRFGRDLEVIEDNAQQRHNSNNRSKRSTDTDEELTRDDEYDNAETAAAEKIPFRYYYPLSAGVPNYVFAPELSVLPPMYSKRGSGGTGNGNFIRLG